MRLIARTTAAVVAIILGLALVGVAAFGNGASPVGRPPVPDDEPKVGAIKPVDPDSRTRTKTSGKAPSPAPTIDVFATEFGKRGKHQVSVSVGGGVGYVIRWRDGETDTDTGAFNRTRTLTGGFPLVQVAVQKYAGGAATCSITIDGEVKDRQSTSKAYDVVFCEA